MAQENRKTVKKPPPPRRDAAPSPGWTFLTNHSHVLLCLARDPELRLRDVADRVGITERGVQKIVQDLETAGVLAITKDGRRNRYTINPRHPFHHPIEAHCKVADLFDLVLGTARP